MYGWIFRHLPGNRFWQVLQSLVLVAAVVAVLFTWVFPWVADTFNINGDPNFD
ncbi:hypothetical protein ACFP63_18915 [Oerskovia jenensis]|uniref:ABC transporter permease n=3 Tax=Oerskovia TaxID=162491 RepID=A0ABR8V4F3_9CELL|nr:MULTISPECIES: hypothetical protein [Oerskovia]MBD7999657.1 hypothetical protein [Oerskovia gallyi]MBM7477544.1 hypothetical protein [Oerskovia jenensis]MBM7497231.1 hypothetical protein [Oerskovia paurometabola]